VSFRQYVDAGWAICALERGQKGPTYPRWQTRPIAADAADGLDGAGLLHLLSKTCALDIDNLSAAREWLTQRGIDVDALLADDRAVSITSGTPNRAKLLYRMTRPLYTIKPKASGIELRCSTTKGTSVHDALPPSTHPSGRRYEWGGGILSDWRSPPPIPAALLSLWRELVADPGNVDTSEKVEAVRHTPIDLGALRRAAFKHSPDCEYDEWLKVGMQLHDGTSGAQEGFDIWALWSKGIKRKAYPGEAVLKSHWLSFSSGGSKRVASGAALVAELPAEAEEFPIETNAPSLDTTEEALKAVAKANQQASIEKLEKRLVFVHSAERYFDTERHKVIGSDNAIEHMFTALMPRSKGGRMNPVKVLKASTTKRFVDAVGFHPGADVIFESGGRQFANAYLNELPESLVPTKEEMEKITWLFDRIDDVPYREWLLQFYGHVVQFPGVKIKSAPLIWSDIQGNGKTTLVRTVPSLLVGSQYSREVNSGLLNSDFNDYLLNAWHINLTEFRAGSRGEREAISKKVENWIADDVVSIHPKGMPGYTMPNHFFVTGSSNADDAAAISNQDRKWAIHELHAPQFTDAEQKWIYPEFLLTPRAAGVLRHYFLTVSLAGFTPSAKAPETQARAEMVDASVPADFELLQTAFEQCSEPLSRDIVITQEVTDYVRKHTIAKPSSKRVGRLLCMAPFSGKAVQFWVGKAKYRGVVIRNQGKWLGATGREIMTHIEGNDVDLNA
jgi:Bifunctional DNA primase/polymerase, N-terminal/Family of unknown function (DUF5906)/Primase C terminal 2 (PriCT-2)